jgi:hypothetical protein
VGDVNPRVRGLDQWLTLYCQAARANGGEPDAGRHLLAWAHAAGASDVVATSSTWCYATPESRETWGGMWAERINRSAIADQLLRSGIADRAEGEHQPQPPARCCHRECGEHRHCAHRPDNGQRYAVRAHASPHAEPGVVDTAEVEHALRRHVLSLP